MTTSLRRPTSTWSQADREIGFAHCASIWPSRDVLRGRTVHPLPVGAPLAALLIRRISIAVARESR